jgi:ABC-2 type transport system ATP-binding protein
MWEVESLSNKVSLIKEGRIVAEGSPSDLKEKLSLSYRIEIEVLDPHGGVEGLSTTVGERGYPVISVETSQPSEELVKIMDRLRREGLKVGYVRVHEPGLEEVFEKVMTS